MRGRQQRFVVVNLPDEADALSGLGIEPFAEHRQGARAALADPSREHPRAAGIGHQADLREACTK